MAKITINDKEIEVTKGKTLLEVINENKIDNIPTLCNNKNLEPYTSCFLCVAEVAGSRTLRPTCGTVITDGMVVKTDTERVRESRKTNLELLLSNHYADCYPPCTLECPANTDIQGYIALASRGLYVEGHKLIRETNAFPMVCGKICPRPCESACRRNYVDEPVDIKNIKRFMSERDIKAEEMFIPEVMADNGKSVAVVGAGPAGLSAAYYLRLKGYTVQVFEKLPKPGGMLRYGIPEYRLPKKDLDREIEVITKMGVNISCDQELGKDFTITSLKEKYDAIFIGTGAQLGSRMNIPGEDLNGVFQGVDYLRNVGLGNKEDTQLFGNVFIIGGGNTAIDTARTAIRKGAEKVTIIYRRTEKEMPAEIDEIEDAKEEGVEIRILNNPVEYIGEDNRITKIKLQKMELGEPDTSGRRRPVPIEGSEYTEAADFVIESLGQKIDSSFLQNMSVSKKGTIVANNEIFTTSIDGVFAGGDAVTGPYIVIGAVAQGRKSADSIDKYIQGEEITPENHLGFYIRKDDFKELTPEDFSDKEKIPRNHIQKTSPEIRKNSMMEVEKGFTEEDLLKEAARCMECGCQDVHECKLREYSEEYNVNKMQFIGGDYREDIYESQHKFININTSKCINCGQCIRACSEIQKQSVFTLDKRGFVTTVVPFGYVALDETNCISCGLCVSVCPVGAITEKLPLGKPGPFENRFTETHCTICGDGCKKIVETRDNNFVKISSKIKNNEFFDNLCEQGRFGYEKYIQKEERRLTGGSQIEISKEIENLNPQETLIAISNELLLEEIDHVIKFAKTKNINIYSEIIARDKEKIELLKKSNLSLSNNQLNKVETFENIFYFGDFNEKFNSVSFRKLIRKDKKQNIYLSFNPKEMFFNHKKLNSDFELLEKLQNIELEKTVIAFNLQNINFEILKKLTEFITSKKITNYIILNNHINYQYMIDKIDNKITTNDLKQYKNLIAVNNEIEEFSAFSKTILFKDYDCSNKADIFIPLKSFYEKTGHILNQFGEKKQVIRSIKPIAYEIKDFLKLD